MTEGGMEPSLYCSYTKLHCQSWLSSWNRSDVSLVSKTLRGRQHMSPSSWGHLILTLLFWHCHGFFFLWGTFTDFYFRSVSSNTDSEKWDFLLIQFYLWLHFTIQSTCHGLTGGKLVLRTPITLRHNRIMGSIRQPHNLKQSENTFKQRRRLCFSAFLLMLKSH